MKKQLIVVGVLVLFTLSVVQAESVRSFSGVLKTESGGGDSADWNWAVLVDGMKWRIDIESATVKTGDRYSAGFDGRTTVSITRFGNTSPPPSKLLNSTSIPEINDSTAIIESGVMPSEELLLAHPLWLTFCAPSLLKFFPDGSMPALDGVGIEECFESRNTKFKFKYEMLPGEKFFKTFELMNDGYIRQKGAGGKFALFKRQAPYDNGFVQAKLHAEGLQTGGVPEKTIYERFSAAKEKDGNDHRFDRSTVTILTAGTTNVADDVWLPPPSKVPQVKDRRFSFDTPPLFSIEYRHKGSSWLPKDDPQIMAMYRSDVGLRNEEAQPVGSNKKRATFLVLFGIGGSALLLLLYSLSRKKAQL